MEQALAAFLALVEEVIPLVDAAGATGTVAKIISALETWVPLVIKEGLALVTPVKNIITALQATNGVTADQITQLQQLDAQLDAAFEDAAKGQDPDAGDQ